MKKQNQKPGEKFSTGFRNTQGLAHNGSQLIKLKPRFNQFSQAIAPLQK
jgi:hypothetical protein